MEEKAKIIDIIKDKYRVKFFYQSYQRDFRLEEKRLIKNTRKNEERYDWTFCGWFYSMKEVLKYILKNGYLENQDISTIEKYIEMQNDLFNKIDEMEFNNK